MKKNGQFSIIRNIALSAVILSVSSVYAEDAASVVNDKPVTEQLVDTQIGRAHV